MPEARTIFQGDSTGWYISRGSLSLATGYNCRIKVVGTAVDRAVTTLVADDAGNPNRRFYAELTPAETALFALGTYVVIIQLATDSGDYSDEDHYILTVQAQGIGGTDAPSPPTEADKWRDRINLVDAAIEARLAGDAIREAWRDGRRIIRESMTMKELTDLRLFYEQKLSGAELLASGGARRRGIPVRFAV